MREFKQDTAFRRNLVFKTPFRNDVARVYLRNDDYIVVQHGGISKPIKVTGSMPLTTALSLASDALDNWDASIN